jgi:hypothetical protein
MLWFIALVVCLAHPAFGEGRQWLRRITLAASCAASIWDLQTTRTAVARGARESNRLVADAAGNPRWGRMIGLKAGLCVGTAVAQETVWKTSGVPWTPLNAGLAGYFSGIALRNRGVANSLKRRARAPAYLLAQP